MQNILDFEKDYPEALVIKLEQNYRSTSLILDAAHAVIERNRNRKEKQLWTEREGGQNSAFGPLVTNATRPSAWQKLS